jgi:hypothetical protein
MAYTNGDGISHDRRTCRRLHRTGGRIVRTDTRDTDDLERCPNCTDDTNDDGPTDAERDIAGLIDMGICPWCEDDPEYENVGSHAAQVHAEEYQAYKAAE